MARVAAFIPDLLFGSNVLGALQAAGHEVSLCADAAALAREAPGAAVVVIDLTAEAPERLAAIEELRAGGGLGYARTLGFYSHVEADTRALALGAGLDRVVPRSRMAREGPALVAALAGSP